jgi:uncharacterized membrane protein
MGLLHVAAGAAWFGGSLFVNFVVMPFIVRQPPARQRDLIGGLILGPERLMIATALGAAITGLSLGPVLGRIDSLAALASPYGLVWIGAILVALAVFAVGFRVTSPAARSLRNDDAMWSDQDGSADSRRAQAMVHLRLGFRMELAGIAMILVLMTLLARL